MCCENTLVRKLNALFPDFNFPFPPQIVNPSTAPSAYSDYKWKLKSLGEKKRHQEHTTTTHFLETTYCRKEGRKREKNGRKRITGETGIRKKGEWNAKLQGDQWSKWRNRKLVKIGN